MLKSIKQKFSSKIYYKLFFAFLAIGIVPFVLVMLYIDISYSNRLSHEIKLQQDLVELSIVDEIEDFFNSLDQVSILFYSENMQKVLRKEGDFLEIYNNNLYIESAVRVNQDLYGTMDKFLKISFVKKSGIEYEISNSKVEVPEIKVSYNENLETEVYKKHMVSKVSDIETIYSENEELYVYVRRIDDIGGEIGQLYIFFDKAALMDTIYNFGDRSLYQLAIENSSHEELFVTDENMDLKPTKTYSLEEFDLRVVFYKDQEIMMETVDKLKKITSLILFLTISVILILSRYLTRYLVRPITQLSSKLRSVKKGDYSRRIEVTTTDEIGEVCTNFNEMSEEIDSLVNQNYQIKLKENEAIIAALQSQINPHFLYNTLDMIKSMSDIYGVHEVSDVILALSKTFRYATNTRDYIVTVKDEINNLQNYMTVANARYGGKVEFKVIAPEEVMALPIMKVCLQPIIENALNHGLSKRGGKGTVTVEFQLEKETMHISLRDNGLGMSFEQLNEIRQSLSGRKIDEDVKEGSIGLKNINDRICLHYGDCYGLQLESDEGGTEVMLTYPIGGENEK